MASRDDSSRGISMINRRALIAIAASVGFGTFAFGRDRSIIVASTTSTEDSGLFRYILPLFKAKTGIDVKVVRKGQARRSTLDGAVTPTWCSCMPKRPRKNF